MRLKYIKTILPPQDGAAKITACAWAPNNSKLALCNADCVVLLFDENGERKDRFSTKPIDPKYGKHSYAVRALVFSPDSTKIAIGQTDNVIYIYKIGLEWGEKKVICNKLIQTSSITCLTWPSEGPVVFGLANGKVRMANVKTNKSQTLLPTESFVVSLVSNVSGNGILSGHADGSVVRLFFDEEASGELQGKLFVHPCPPYAMVWTPNSIVVAGCDKKVIVYNREGRPYQQFDYSRDPTEQELTVAAASPSGQSIVIGSYNRLRIYNWIGNKYQWEERRRKDIPNLYTVTCLAWKRDGSKLAVGNLCGALELYDCSLKKSIYNNKFEVTFVGPSQVLISEIRGSLQVSLKSNYGSDIIGLKIMGNDQYVVAYTGSTIIIGDMVNNSFSEVQWHGNGESDKFNFDNENLCLVYNAGELSLIEYGSSQILGSVRTEFMSPHLLSVRINERKLKNGQDNKKLAYLLDVKTISIMDLIKGVDLAQVSHDTKIDWLELNETGRKLLFRDKRQRLFLFDIEEQEKIPMLTHCGFVQWVPGSDVVVAQNRNNLCIWYNINTVDRVTMFPIKGEVTDIERMNGKTDVIVNEGLATVAYTLDEGLVEFGTAIDDGDFYRAIVYLESLEISEETESMWQTLGRLALSAENLAVAERCFAAVGDVARARFLKETIKIGEEASRTMGEDGFKSYKVKARMAILEKQYKLAENIYLEQNKIEEALAMYQQLHKWDDALALAESRHYPDLDELERRYLKWLKETGQDEKAGDIALKSGNLEQAIELFLKSGVPTKAARVIISHSHLENVASLVPRVVAALTKGEFYQQAGELYEHFDEYHNALDCYKKGKAFGSAVDLARRKHPSDVTELEHLWGDFLLSIRNLEGAVSHFVEANQLAKAVETAISCRQWRRAVQIIELVEDINDVNQYFPKIAEHFASIEEYEIAEHFYVQGNMTKGAVEMYNNAGKWEKAHRLAIKYLDPQEVKKMYISQAKELVQQSKYKEAEKLYIVIEEPDLAISMYKKVHQYDNMVRLVKQYHPELLVDTHLHLAKELESEGNYKQAEHHFLAAGDWKQAINMYRGLDMWEDAYRIAKSHGGPLASKQIAYLWSKSLGGEMAVKLLSRFGLLESAIDYASENLAFDFALDLANRAGLTSKVPEIELRKALHFEDEGRFSEAEAAFVSAGRPREAVLMYVHAGQWDAARRVAEQHDPPSLPDVLVGHAKSSFEHRDYAKAEALLLRAQRADLAIKLYKEAGMWSDALRVCKEYIPSMLPQLQEEYDNANATSSNTTSGKRDIETIVAQAKEWELAGHYSKAVDLYLQLTTSHTSNLDLLAECWTKAAELAIKFMDAPEIVVKQIVPRLVEIKNYSMGSQLLLGANRVREALDLLADGGEWSRARQVARELDPRYAEYVESRYRDHLRSQGRAEDLAALDVPAALDTYAQQRQWKKCLDLAEQQDAKVLHKYVALCATQQILDGKPLSALKLYIKYGTPAYPQNFNIYKRIASSVFILKDLFNANAYSTWANLRDLLYDLSQNLERATNIPMQDKNHFTLLLLISHYYATRSACLGQQALQKHAAKISISLLRYTDVIPAHKAFYEAGLAAKDVGWENMAFVFWNHYLDLYEAIEEGSLDTLDHAEFQNTDIPFEIPLPGQQYLTEAEHEQVKEWVLTASLNDQVEQVLPLDERNTYEACLVSATTKVVSPPCIITGYPVIRNKLEFKRPEFAANKDDWNSFLMTAKMSHSTECQDVIKFISLWCGGGPNLGYTFQ